MNIRDYPQRIQQLFPKILNFPDEGVSSAQTSGDSSPATSANNPIGSPVTSNQNFVMALISWIVQIQVNSPSPLIDKKFSPKEFFIFGSLLSNDLESHDLGNINRINFILPSRSCISKLSDFTETREQTLRIRVLEIEQEVCRKFGELCRDMKNNDFETPELIVYKLDAYFLLGVYMSPHPHMCICQEMLTLATPLYTR